MRWIASIIFYRVLNWKLEGTIDPSIKKCIIIVAPHTSWYDFIVGLMVRSILDLQINFVGKRELFRPPFGWYFRWVGGTPLDRTPNQDKVQQISQIFLSKKIFRLALSPEGTRKKTDRWKTGFYFIAKATQSPIIKVAFDYAHKTVKISTPFYTTNDPAKDLAEIEEFYRGIQGKISRNF